MIPPDDDDETYPEVPTHAGSWDNGPANPIPMSKFLQDTLDQPDDDSSSEDRVPPRASTTANRPIPVPAAPPHTVNRGPLPYLIPADDDSSEADLQPQDWPGVPPQEMQPVEPPRPAAPIENYSIQDDPATQPPHTPRLPQPFDWTQAVWEQFVVEPPATSSSRETRPVPRTRAEVTRTAEEEWKTLCDGLRAVAADAPRKIIDELLLRGGWERAVAYVQTFGKHQVPVLHETVTNLVKAGHLDAARMLALLATRNRKLPSVEWLQAHLPADFPAGLDEFRGEFMAAWRDAVQHRASTIFLIYRYSPRPADNDTSTVAWHIINLVPPHIATVGQLQALPSFDHAVDFMKQATRAQASYLAALAFQLADAGLALQAGLVALLSLLPGDILSESVDRLLDLLPQQWPPGWEAIKADLLEAWSRGRFDEVHSALRRIGP